MLVTIQGRQTLVTYLVESDTVNAERVIDLAEMLMLYKRFEAGDVTLTDEQQLLALIVEKSTGSLPSVDLHINASTDELI